MSDEITTNDSINLSKGDNIRNRGISANGKKIDQTGDGYVSQIQDVGVSEEALVMGDLSTPGRYVMVNNSADYNIQIGVINSNGFFPLDELKPGEASSGRLATVAPYAKAIGGTAELEYWIAED